MKISPKVLMIVIYVVITFIAAATIQRNPDFLHKVDEFTKYI